MDGFRVSDLEAYNMLRDSCPVGSLVQLLNYLIALARRIRVALAYMYQSVQS